MNSNVKQDFSSTLEGSVLTLTCENEISSIMHMNTTDEHIITVTCHSSGNWIPDPIQFTCSPSTTSTSTATVTVPSGIKLIILRIIKFNYADAIITGSTWSTLLTIILILSGVILIIFLLGLLLIIICVIKRKCVATKTSKTSRKDLRSQEPTYEEVSDTHLKGIQMEGNAAYSHMILAS